MRTLFTGIVHDMVALKARYGTDLVCTPLIEIVPVEDDSELRQVQARLSAFDYLLFTSRHAVAAMRPGPAAPRIISIGRTTSEALRQTGITHFEQVEQDNSYGVIEWFSHQQPGSVLIPRSNLALDIIPEGLRRLGFEVETVTAYVNRMPFPPQKVDLSRIDRIVFTSPSTIDNFIRLYGRLPEGKAFVTRGPVTEQYLQTIIKQQSL